MVVDGTNYLRTSYFGALVFLKGTAALGYGACDLLNVAFAEQMPNGETADVASSSRRMGVFFSLVGIGCLVGPIVAKPYIYVECPRTLQVSCLVAFGLSVLGILDGQSFHTFGP